MKTRLLVLSAVLLVAGILTAMQRPAMPRDPGDMLHQDLAMRGDDLNARVYDINVPAGKTFGPHSHPCEVVGYVVDGSIETQLNGQAVEHKNKGELFHEPPGAEHMMMRSATAGPARVIAFMVCNGKGPDTLPFKPAEKK